MSAPIRLISQAFDTASETHVEVNIPRGTFERFTVCLSGTNGTVAANAGNAGNMMANLWQCQIEVEGELKSTFLNPMMYIANLRWFGSPYYVSTDAGVFGLAWRIPATWDRVQLPNSWYSRSKGAIKLIFDCQADLNQTNLAGGNTHATLEVYAVPIDFEPRFIPIYRQEQITTLTATGPNPIPSRSVPNPSELFILPCVTGSGRYATVGTGSHAIAAAGYIQSAAGTTVGYPSHLNNIVITKDGRVIANVSGLMAVADGNMEDSIELTENNVPDPVANTSLVHHFKLWDAPGIEGHAGSNIELELACDGTAIDPLILYVGMEFAGDMTQEGQNFVDSNRSANLAKIPAKSRANFTKTVSVARGHTPEQVQAILKANKLTAVTS